MAISNDATGRPTRGDTPPADPNAGLRSNLKILVPLVALVGVVFGITFLVLHKPSEPLPEGPGPEGNSNAGPPLRFFTSARHFDARPIWGTDPVPVNLQDHFFPGFFERNTETKTSFWFQNHNDKPVAVQLKGVSCASCSGGSLAPIPTDAVRNLLQTLAVASLPQGLVSPLPIAVAGPWADTVPKLQWQSHKFATTDWTFQVPAADDKDGWSPQWGILELNFNTGGKKELDALFASQVQPTGAYSEDKLTIAFQVVNAFDAGPPTIEVGELADTSKPQTHDFFVYSSTRPPGTGLGELPPPVCTIRMPGGAGEPGKLIAVGTPVLLPPAEVERFVERTTGGKGSSAGVRVTAAYRVPVRITPEADGDRLDIGLLEREIWVTAPGTPGGNERLIRVRGTVRGSVSLSEGKEVALRTFKGEHGGAGEARITTERPGMELAVLADQSRPDFLEVSLKKLPDDPDRGYYQLTVRVPPKRQFGSIQNGLVVLEIKGPKPQRIRIPVTGKGEF
jgi:hypothetical protein